MGSSAEPRLDSIFRIQTVLALLESDLSGYDLAKRIEETTGTKPSSGKIYPFLHQLKESGYIIEIEEAITSERGKTVYQLTKKGRNLVNELLDRMGNILDARLEQLLDTCRNCAVRLYDSSVMGIDEEGEEATYCCTHCRSVYYANHGISE